MIENSASNNGERNLKVKSEYIILTLCDKPESNVRKVADKGIMAFVVDNPENHETASGSHEIDLLESKLDINKYVEHGESVENIIKYDIIKQTGLMESTFWFKTIGINTKESMAGSVVLKTLVIVKQNVAKHLMSISNIRGSWVWFNADRDDDGNPSRIRLANKCEHPEIEMTVIHSNRFDEIVECVEWARHSLYFTDIVFEFLPSEFTLSNFEKSFNAINGKEATTIKKKWVDRFEDTGKIIDGTAHRPAKLYRHAVK